MVWNYEHGHLSTAARVCAGVWAAICYALYIWQLVVGPILVVEHLTHWVILFHALYFSFLALYFKKDSSLKTSTTTNPTLIQTTKKKNQASTFWKAQALATACLWQFSTFVLGGTIIIIFVTQSQVQGELTADDNSVALTVTSQVFLHIVPIIPLAVIAHKPIPVPPVLLSSTIVVGVIVIYNLLLLCLSTNVFQAYNINSAATPYGFFNATSGEYTAYSSSSSQANTIALAQGMATWLIMTLVITESWFRNQFMH